MYKHKREANDKAATLQKRTCVVTDHKLNMSQCHAVAKEGKHLARIYKRHIAWRTYEAILLLCSALLIAQFGGLWSFDYYTLRQVWLNWIESREGQQNSSEVWKAWHALTKKIWKNVNYLAQRPASCRGNTTDFRYKIEEGMIFSLGLWWVE